MSDSPDDLMEAETVEPLPFPTSVRAAALLWVVIGAVFVLVSFGGEVAVTLAREERGLPPRANGNCSAMLGILIGIAFFATGMRVLRGKALDVLTPCILSVVVGVIYMGLGAMSLSMADNQPQRAPPVVAVVLVVAGILSAGIGGGLSLAGVLGFVGRAAYLAWLDENPVAPARRRRRRPPPFAEEIDDDDPGTGRRA
jgi:hypothetical protein